MIRTLVAMLLVLSAAQTPAEDTTNRVVELLADYQVNHDLIYNKKFAFVGKGIQIRGDKGATETADRWYLCVYEGANRRLDASSYEGGQGIGRYHERWLQFLSYDGEAMYREGLLKNPVIDAKAESWDEYQGRRDLLAVPQPLKHIMTSDIGLTRWVSPNKRCSTEYLLSDSAKLLEGKYDKNGDVLANFRLVGNIPVTRQIRFSKKEKFFPVSMIQIVTLGGKEITHTVTEVRWKHHQEFSVPSSIALIRFPLGKGASRTKVEVKFDWKVGNELTRAIDPKLDDWRKPFRSLFAADWQERGGVEPPR